MLHFVKLLEEMSISHKPWQLIAFREQTPPALVNSEIPSLDRRHTENTAYS